MASRNNETANAVGSGPFHPRPPRETGEDTKWHKPGTVVSENDRVPEFHAETYPPGTAPAESTFQPNPIHEIPGQANNPDTRRAHGKESTFTDPLSTLGGATSADVHQGWGKPAYTQTSNELRHDGERHRKHHGAGLEGVGASDPSAEKYHEDLKSDH